jgi:predicted alpha/beta-hydrolase family hydrolase
MIRTASRPDLTRQVVETSAGPAWVDLTVADGAAPVLLLGHGAGGGVDAPDLVAVRDGCLGRGISVALVTQPYRVAGRRAPPAAPVLDRAWAEIVAAMDISGDVIFGGRSSGSRVACRAAADPGRLSPRVACRAAADPGRLSTRVACRAEANPGRLIGVLALAFPLHPPGKPEKTRIAELDAVSVPVLVVQGIRDPFGQPPQAPGREVLSLPGDHSLRQSVNQLGAIVTEWISRLQSRP